MGTASAPQCIHWDLSAARFRRTVKMTTDHASDTVITAGAQVVLDQGALGTGADEGAMLAGNRKSEIGNRKNESMKACSAIRAEIRRRGGILTEAIQSSRPGCPWPPLYLDCCPWFGAGVNIGLFGIYLHAMYYYS